jgi:O-antigen/teichoic acid export membrane protein
MSVLKFGEERRPPRALARAATDDRAREKIGGFARRIAWSGAKIANGMSTSVRHVVDRASWTLFDQCTVSAGNFLLNVLLARALGQDEYGKFALFLGAIFILRVVDYAMISYPLSLRLPVAREQDHAGLLGFTVLLAAALSLVLVAVMGLGVALLGAVDLLLPACLCYLCWQAQETARRCLLAEFRYREAIPGDAIAYVGQAILLVVLLRLTTVTLSTTLYAMSAAFAFGAVVHASKLRFAWPRFAGVGRLILDYFSVGKWSLVVYLLQLLRVQLLPWLLATLSGTASTASLQASFNIANMMNPVVLGMGNAVPQIAAHAHRSAGIRGAVRAASGYLLFGLAPILVICFAGVLLPHSLLRAAYGPSSPYLAVALCLQLLMVAGVLDYVAEMISKTLLGVQAGKPAFLVNVASVVTALALAVLLIGPLGVTGACLALVAASLVRMVGAAISMAWLIRRDESRSAVDGDRPIGRGASGPE